MLKMLLPFLLATGGLGAGVAAGILLKGPVEPTLACGEGDTGETCADPAAAAAAAAAMVAQQAAGFEYFAIEKPFVVPVFADNRVVAMVVLSLSLDAAPGQVERLTTLQPRLRDGLLAVLFRHANSGGFDGSFTTGQKMADLKSGLLAAAREVAGAPVVRDILVTDIVRQDV